MDESTQQDVDDISKQLELHEMLSRHNEAPPKSFTPNRAMRRAASRTSRKRAGKHRA